MSGISHMLPFVVAGGVMLALSLLLQHLGGPANWYHDLMTNVGNAALCHDVPDSVRVHRGTALPTGPA